MGGGEGERGVEEVVVKGMRREESVFEKTELRWAVGRGEGLGWKLEGVMMSMWRDALVYERRRWCGVGWADLLCLESIGDFG